MRVEYDPGEPQVFAVDPDRNVVVLETDGWESREEPVFDEGALEPADTAVIERTHAVVEELCGPPVHVLSVDGDGGRRRIAGRGRIEIDPDTVVQLCSTVRVALRATGIGELVRHGDRVVISFDEPTPVTLGWGTRVSYPEGSVVVPRSVRGVARYLTHAGCAVTDTTPDRTWPNIRDHPPRLRFGGDSVPDWVREDRPDTGVRLVVPDELETLLPLAPLVHYLGARVEVEAGARPTLEAGGRRESLGDTPAAADDRASRLLRRVFYLDCLARSAGPYGKRLPQTELLAEWGLSADSLYDAPITERVARYLSVPFDPDRFPEWHLGVHMEPTFTRAKTLPSHLNRLSDVYCPESAELTVVEQARWSLDAAFTRGSAAPSDTDEPPVVEPADRARTVGWAGPSAAVGAFNSVPEAYANREAFQNADESLSVLVVNNSVGMFGEHQQAIQNYSDRVEDVPIMELEARAMVPPEVLAELFESRVDLIHYIGHCDEEGLRCAKGRHLDMMSISDTAAQTFFLNACGSYDQGRELLRKGSVAGVVTRVTAKETTATRVGNDWSRMIANGWSAERALDVARRATDSAGNYITLGDGRYTVTHTDGYIPPEVHLETIDDDRYLVRSHRGGPRDKGAENYPWPDNDQLCLMNKRLEFTIKKDQLIHEMEEYDYLAPVVVDGEIVWSTDQLSD